MAGAEQQLRPAREASVSTRVLRLPNESRLVNIVKRYPLYHPWSLKPVVLSAIGYGSAIAMAVFIDKKYFPHLQSACKLKTYAALLTLYYGLIFAVRVRIAQSTSILFEQLWGCNVALKLASIGLYFGRPLLLSSALAIVGIDQTTYVCKKIRTLLISLLYSFPLLCFWFVAVHRACVLCFVAFI